MFTLSAVVTNVSTCGTLIKVGDLCLMQTIALPVGMLLDRAGPRLATLLGAFFFFLGNVVFGIGIETSCEWLSESIC
jgi:hypothetical protein